MPAYQLTHTHTGLSLYEVGDASEADIERANTNLAASGSSMRYQPVTGELLASIPTDATLGRHSIPTP